MILRFNVGQNLATVFQHISEPEKFVSVHPLIFKMDVIDAFRYKVHEKVRIGWIPIRFTYNVEIENNGTNEVIMRAVIFKITRLNLHFKLTEEGEVTCISEDAKVTAPFPVKYIMYKILARQHQLMFSNIEKLNL